MIKLICNTNLKTATSKKARNVRENLQNQKDYNNYNNSLESKIDRAKLHSGKHIQIS